ncbi:glycosyltransferase family 2 protein [Candidatus Gottesmanbacteria bacterium]|nr:glycosyltransferase family 2 protein [Candidatus Gottesmanbacteria bacterium]
MQLKDNNSISAIIITHNEEINIEKCLKSISWVDEIIILDSYSTDETPEIAKKYTKNIYFHKFENNFSNLRNLAIKYAKGDWILTIDSDESLPRNAELIIRKLVLNSKTEGFWFPRRNYIDDKNYLKYGYFYPDFQLRLFKNHRQIKYSGIIHEQPLIDKEKTKTISNLEIYHNNTHTKYNSLFSFNRFYPYIKIEGKYKASHEKNVIFLIMNGFKEIVNNLHKSFIKCRGYKDGYIGFKAAFLHSLYLGTISFYAAFIRLKRDYDL